MTLTWHDAKEKKPEHGQRCYIGSDEALYIIGPIPYNEQATGWLDIFATPEAGVICEPSKPIVGTSAVTPVSVGIDRFTVKFVWFMLPKNAFESTSTLKLFIFFR